MNGAAPNMGSTHATAVKATGAHAAAMKAATSTTASKRVIGHQAGSNEDGCRETNQTITNHGLPPDGEAPSIRWLFASNARANGDGTRACIWHFVVSCLI
ncbi:hypothetical protein GGD63_002042 [Bradyrhizobium sp. cir1]|uniref:hypothetical protein n=1 Tax=Bradyrhizobium sp. cir1 TaxID=1445730 RepID=UPI00182B8CC1|nr:hypothetical protein [Bradyrhizobium sp. cir1]